ncbi:hypothetical protein SH501x_000927 [Pirellulaceae bacterium SH501]
MPYDFHIRISRQHDETSYEWSILDPNFDEGIMYYSGDVAASGEAGSNSDFLLLVKNGPGTIMKSVNGNPQSNTWSATLAEPQGGWPIPQNLSFIAGNVELRVGGVVKDTTQVRLVP